MLLRERRKSKLYLYNSKRPTFKYFQVSFSHLARGDLDHAIRPDFDPVTFVYDAAVGSTALLGIGWIVSVVL